MIDLDKTYIDSNGKLKANFIDDAIKKNQEYRDKHMNRERQFSLISFQPNMQKF